MVYDLNHNYKIVKSGTNDIKLVIVKIKIIYSGLLYGTKRYKKLLMKLKSCLYTVEVLKNS